MKVGIVLPSFRSTADEALAVAERAEQAGIDGVFCFDHLWPLGQPHRPAIAPFPLLGAVARRTERVCIGTLVARIGLVPDDVLRGEFAALDLVAPGRVIAGLGTGDHLSAAENAAFGLPATSAGQRLESLARCASALHADGVAVWIGGRHRSTKAIAEDLGVAVNLWAAPVGEVAEQSGRSEVTWAGVPPGGASGANGGNDNADNDNALRALVSSLASAGASWAVFAWPVSLEKLAESARR